MSILMAEDYILQGGCGERILKNAKYLLFVNVKWVLRMYFGHSSPIMDSYDDRTLNL